MAELIDLHNHILPGVDDGAATLAESVDIARQFVSEGVTRVAATPHLNPERHAGVGAEQVRRKVDEVRTALADAGVPLDVVPGNELYLVPAAPEIAKRGDVSTLGESRYLLVELSLLASGRPLFFDDTVFRLGLEEFGVILAHPERYSFVQRDISVLDEARDRGVILQLTAPALLGEYGREVRRVAEQLLRRGAYALAASDRHHPGATRSLAAMHERIAEVCDTDTADLLLCENPARVLNDAPMQEPQVSASSRPSLLDRLLGR
jgi:protein-tyrosine phosphatase